MIYTFQGGLHEIDAIPPERICPVVGFLSVNELETLAPKLGFAPSTVQECKEQVRYFRSSIEVYDKYSFGTVKRTVEGDEGADCIGFYLMRNLFLVIDIRDSDGGTKHCFSTALRRFSPTGVTAQKLVFAFFDALIEGDGRLLEDIEFSLFERDRPLPEAQEEEDSIAPLLQQKRELLLLRNYYEQLIDLGKALEEDENDLFPGEELRYFKIFTDKAERLERNVRSLREQVMQFMEAHQSALAHRQDQSMRIFTVLSAIFLPLNLITGWYGMNFTGMPELYWKYGYLYVGGLALAVFLLCIYFFRRQRWL